MKNRSPDNRSPHFLLCDYFNSMGKPIERIYIATDARDDAADRLRQALRDHRLDLLLDVMKAEANISSAMTNFDDAALALNALLNEVAEKRVRLADARQIASISVNFLKAVSIADVMPALENNFGGHAASWVRGIFRHLNLGTPYIH